jgi:ribonuclease H2 subunit C
MLKIPAGYNGVVVSALDDILPKKEVEGDDEEEEEPEVKIMEEKSVFDEVMIWGHEAVMDESDPYVRGLEEWIGFAEQIHSYESAVSKQTK